MTRVPTAAMMLAVFLAAPPARAHFLLRAPASWRAQDALGNPQKLGPCGDEGNAAATGMVTTVAPGATITITLDETIFHPGHYRIALAVDARSELPAEPPVTPGATACGSVPIMDPPVFPVLADGMLAHTTPLQGTQSIQVTLPPDVTCARCTLQVLEFMSNHAAPCFYHHCADLAIVAPECTVDADCDDADPCTRDACTAAGCVVAAITPADAGAGVRGVITAEPCTSARIPRGLRGLLRKTAALTTRAASKPAKAQALLARAASRLQRVASKLARGSGRRLPAECRGALTTALTQAETHVACLRADAS